MFDAHVFVSELIKKATFEIILLDNYIDESTLTLLSKRSKTTKILLLTKNISKQLELDLKKVNDQYGNYELKEFKASHDRFLIIDRAELYHLGASLKDFGKKWFAFSKLEGMMESLLTNLLKIKHSGRVEGNKAF